MNIEISHLETLFCDINRYFDLLVYTSTPLIQFGPLRSQLDAAYSKLVFKTLKIPQNFLAFSMASVAYVLTTTLRVIDRGSDAFPPLKSAVGIFVTLLALSNPVYMASYLPRKETALLFLAYCECKLPRVISIWHIINLLL
ncbi:hypothetical protein K435DRAFT_503877 [Dendrothele bispora CBS 962.96]|uniref:Uncharacterized protein n=1 Tax=Dendrothele bispora (strain CBS 962.96) TaxID=1314807 RepID=A0A4S8KWQ5_DENBC|nr:hypothetical protein K435DRAFT_503877 [Dendrothele bispora CBS 962.96]